LVWRSLLLLLSLSRGKVRVNGPLAWRINLSKGEKRNTTQNFF
jgi:hypothetical protein